ncbi:MAG TPA: hypothetical protein VJ574_00665, partial [Candidatus Bathyarchaeia archaeon]|nr:hypothetical protein [Candidatus Bathyarchaeia archaeon]
APSYAVTREEPRLAQGVHIQAWRPQALAVQPIAAIEGEAVARNEGMATWLGALRSQKDSRPGT